MSLGIRRALGAVTAIAVLVIGSLTLGVGTASASACPDRAYESVVTGYNVKPGTLTFGDGSATLTATLNKLPDEPLTLQSWRATERMAVLYVWAGSDSYLLPGGTSGGFFAPPNGEGIDKLVWCYDGGWQSTTTTKRSDHHHHHDTHPSTTTTSASTTTSGGSTTTSSASPSTTTGTSTTTAATTTTTLASTTTAATTTTTVTSTTTAATTTTAGTTTTTTTAPPPPPGPPPSIPPPATTPPTTTVPPPPPGPSTATTSTTTTVVPRSTTATTVAPSGTTIPKTGTSNSTTTTMVGVTSTSIARQDGSTSTVPENASPTTVVGDGLVAQAGPTTTTAVPTQAPAEGQAADASIPGGGEDLVTLPSPGDILDGVARDNAPLLVAGFAIASLLTVVGALKAFLASRVR